MTAGTEDPHNGRALAAALAGAMLLASLGTSIANVALPDIAAAFAAPFHDVQGVVVAYLGAMTVSVVVAGPLGDRYGPKPMLLAGLALFLLASLTCALAPDLRFLLAARALQGMGAAFLMTLSTALMRQTAPAARLGRAMGLLGTMSAIGTALGPSVGGLLVPVFGWRSLFWIQVPLAAAVFALSRVVLPRQERIDGMTVPRLRTAFDRSLAPHLLFNLLVAMVMMTTLVVGPFYLSLGLGLPTAHVGAVMAIGPVLSILLGVPAGRLADHFGSGRVVTAGLALLVLGTLLLAILPNALGIAGYAAALLVLTPGYQLFQAANNTAALADVPRPRQATVSGLLGLSRNVGLVLGAALMGAVFANAVGAQTLGDAGASAMRDGMRATFLLASATMMVAAGLSLRLKRRSDRA